MINYLSNKEFLCRIEVAFVISIAISVSLLVFPTVKISISMAACIFTVIMSTLICAAYLDLLIHGSDQRVQKTVKKPGFDYSTHYFRAFAIFCVMACHFFGCAGYDKLNLAILTASTHYFLFISGYLCQYLYSRRPEEPVKYYAKKAKNVVAPYLCFTVIFSIIPFASEIGHGGFQWLTFLKMVLHNLFWGSAQLQYWYIPFIISLFVVSPLICRASDSTVKTILALTFIASILIPVRQCPFTYYWPGVLYLYTYFVPYYILGFVYARYKDLINDFLDQHILIVLSLSMVLVLILLFGEYTRVQFVHSDLVVSLQRFAMIGVILWLFRRLSKGGLRVLDLMAEYSFALFFMHMYVFAKAINCISMVRDNFIAAALVFASLVAVLMVACYGIKRCLGGFSRIIIGA